MRALACIRPGELEYISTPAPVLRPGRAILKIKRIGICGTDLHAYRGTQPYFNYPRILGHELAADLVDADYVSGFVPGESVTFIPYLSCKKCIACRMGKPNCCVDLKVYGVHIDGGMTDYISVPVDLLIKSQDLNYDQLALIEPLAIGAHGIKRAAIKTGEFVLVIGAGPIGLGTMEFARIAGGRVIALDINDARLDFCKNKMKIDYAINASNENVVNRLGEITNGDMPTVVIDATGSQKAINNALQYLAHGGRYILIGLQKEDLIFSHPEFHKRESTLLSSRNATREDFDFVIDTVKNGLIDPLSYITHRVTFEELNDAFRNWQNPSANMIKAIVEKE
jgi:2-desacetyl-2-hydroxyethyl bacteriochlorophyllide A dehydrogenase